MKTHINFRNYAHSRDDKRTLVEKIYDDIGKEYKKKPECKNIFHGNNDYKYSIVEDQIDVNTKRYHLIVMYI